MNINGMVRSITKIIRCSNGSVFARHVTTAFVVATKKLKNCS